MKLTPNISLCAIVSLLGIFAAPASGALVAYWSFDDCSAVDNSGNGYDGTIIGSLDCLAGVSGNAFYFDNSSGNYVSVANSEQLSPTNMTITAWIKAEEIPQDYASSHIVSTYDGNSTVAKGYSLFYRPNTEPNLFGIQLSDGVDTNSLEAVHPDQACSKWIFLAAVFEEREQYGNKAELYLNANLVGRALADGFHGSEQSIVNLTIGTAAHVPTRPYHQFEGMIDEVRIYDQALSASEILALYGRSSEGNTLCDTPVVSPDLRLSIPYLTHRAATGDANYWANLSLYPNTEGLMLFRLDALGACD